MVEVLLAGDGRAGDAARHLSETGSWSEALALAQAWKVIPQLSARIQSLHIELPTADKGTLRREFLEAYAHSAMRVTKAIPAIGELQQAGIPVVAFKGAASMALLYGDPKHRTIADVDLLILRNNLRDALVCLERSGFARRGSETLEEYLRFVKNAPGLAGNQSITLFGNEGGEIDLHWTLDGSGLGTEEILERAGTARLMGATIPVVDPKDGYLLTVHHVIREGVAIEGAGRDLFDIRLWCEHLQENHQLDAAMKWVARSGYQASALAVASLLRSYDDSSAAARAAELLNELTSPSERRSAALLTELFHYQIGNGRLAEDVLYLVHSRPWRQILQGLGRDWSGYRRSMDTFDKNLNQEISLPQRVAALARAIPGLRGLRLARELARIKYEAPKKMITRTPDSL
jgi:hypothetical protein